LKGTIKAIAFKTVQKMQERYTSKASDLKIFLGRVSVNAVIKWAGIPRIFSVICEGSRGKLFVDVISANRDQLLLAGVRQENIVDSGICTCCNKDYFSFRRDGAKAGRMVSLMMLV